MNTAIANPACFDITVTEQFDNVTYIFSNIDASNFMGSDNEASLDWEASKLLEGDAFNEVVATFVNMLGNERHGFGLYVPTEITPIYA